MFQLLSCPPIHSQHIYNLPKTHKIRNFISSKFASSQQKYGTLFTAVVGFTPFFFALVLLVAFVLYELGHTSGRGLGGHTQTPCNNPI